MHGPVEDLRRLRDERPEINRDIRANLLLEPNLNAFAVSICRISGSFVNVSMLAHNPCSARASDT